MTGVQPSEYNKLTYKEFVYYMEAVKEANKSSRRARMR